MTTISPKVSADGLEYGPTASGKMYLAMYKHRATKNPHKSFWNTAFKPLAEYQLFDRCDVYGWADTKNNYWGIVNGGKEEIGALGERVGYFPFTDNPSTPWHGYPVSTSDVDYVVPENLLNQWETAGEITAIMAKRIRRGVL